MKKTLIALAVAASAVVSGSAMAWTANGTGGNFEVSGTLTPADLDSPWAVKTGTAVTNLDGSVTKGNNKVKIAVTKAIPVLGIRTQEAKMFQGREGISPQISYGNAVDINAFNDGVATLTLDVMNSENEQKIGTMTSSLFAGGMWASSDNASNENVNSYSGSRGMYASEEGKAFYGGLGTSADSVSAPESVAARVTAIDSEFTANSVSAKPTKNDSTHFSNTSLAYTAFYGSGIEAGQNISITLDTPAEGDEAITWKASLPIVVSYW